VQELAHKLCHMLLMGSYSQFCLILHLCRVAVPFPSTFRRHGGTALFKSMAEQQNLGPPLINDPKTT